MRTLKEGPQGPQDSFLMTFRQSSTAQTKKNKRGGKAWTVYKVFQKRGFPRPP